MTVATIVVSIARDPALVRTVRLVAAAVARRTDGGQDFVEEVRLAVGEACALLVGSADGGSGVPGRLDGGPVEVTLQLDDRLRVVVRACGAVPLEDDPTSDIDGAEPWALLQGLVETLEVGRDDAQTVLTMSWPLPTPAA